MYKKTLSSGRVFFMPFKMILEVLKIFGLPHMVKYYLCPS
jgi:hypothetical protein